MGKGKERRVCYCSNWKSLSGNNLRLLFCFFFGKTFVRLQTGWAAAGIFNWPELPQSARAVNFEKWLLLWLVKFLLCHINCCASVDIVNSPVASEMKFTRRCTQVRQLHVLDSHTFICKTVGRYMPQHVTTLSLSSLSNLITEWNWNSLTLINKSQLSRMSRLSWRLAHPS